MPTALRVAAPLALAALLTACSGGVPGLPAGANVTCSSSADCPSGSTCSAVLARCVRVDGADRQAPAIAPGSAAVAPAVARAGTIVRIAFEVTEPLAAPPVLRLAGAGADLGIARRDGNGYVLEFSVTTEAGAGAHAIVASLVDAAGNVAEAAPVGTVTFDFTPPTAAAPVVTPAFARAGSALTAVVTLSEATAAAPTLSLDPGPALSAAPGPGANQWTFRRVLDGSEPAGALDLVLSARDDAGNELQQRFAGAATLDFTPPAVAAVDVATPTVRAGDTLVAEVRFDEPVGAAPEVRLVAPDGAGVPVSASALDPLTWALAYAVPPGAADGEHALQLAASSDRAGNAGEPVFLGTVFLDSTAPAVRGLAVDHAGALYRAGDLIAVTFSTDEDLAATPVVRLETLPLARDLPCVAGGARTWTCTSAALDGSERPESVVNLSVRVADAAGNVTVAPTSVVLDFSPPTLAGTPALQLVPGPASPRPTVTALGAGATCRIFLIAAEPLAAPPAVVAWDPGGTTSLALALISQAGSAYTYELSTGAGAFPAATWTIRWDPVDLAGNRWPSPRDVASLAVDSAPPPAPATGAADAPLLVWTRAPWGTATSTAPSFRLVGAAGATTDADLAIARDGSGREVGRAAIAAAGFDMALDSDPVDLWVSAVDGAGNESPRTRVVDVAWTAALGGKVPGSTFENPHRLEARTVSFGAVDQAGAAELGAAALGVAGDGLAVETGGASFFRRAFGTQAPPPLDGFALVYDPGRSRTVLMGGYQSGGPMSDSTWEWDGHAWTLVTPLDPEGDGDPFGGSEAVRGQAMAFYDPINAGIVVLADSWLANATTLSWHGSTWLWNGASYRKLGPSIRCLAGGAAWDEARGVAVALGSSDGFDPMRTWEWDGTSWTEVTPPSPSDSPPLGFLHRLAYDPIRGRVLAFGGSGSSAYHGEVWEWDGAARRWSVLAVAADPSSGLRPAGRAAFAMAWDASAPGGGELVVQGGYVQASGGDGRTWVLRQVGDTPTWFDATPATSLAAEMHRAVYDARSRKVLMLAGGVLSAWSGAGAPVRAWSPLAPEDPEGDGNPVMTAFAEGGYAIASNPTRGTTTFHDGMTRDTWEWNRASWRHAATATSAAAPPPARTGAALGAHRTSVILFGGVESAGGAVLGDTWSWDGTAWSLSEASPVRAVPTGTDPRFRADAAMVTNPLTGRLYRFGGRDVAGGVVFNYSDLWEWDAAGAPGTWTSVGGGSRPWPDPQGDGSPGDAATPEVRGFTAWDTHRGDPRIGRLLLFVTTASVMRVWEWIPPEESSLEGNSWVKHEAPLPAGLAVQAMYYDPVLRAPVLVGGFDWEQAPGWIVELLEPDGLALHELPVAHPFGPSAPGSWLGAFDAGAGQAVLLETPLHAMLSAPTSLSRSWAWESGAATPPAHVLHVDFASAHGPDPRACVAGASCPIQRIDVSWSGGGSAPGGSGATLQAWTGAWTTVATAPGSASAPADATWSWTTASPVPAASLFFGPSRQLTLQLVASSPSGPGGMARVGTDAVAVTVHYRR